MVHPVLGHPVYIDKLSYHGVFCFEFNMEAGHNEYSEELFDHQDYNSILVEESCRPEPRASINHFLLDEFKPFLVSRGEMINNIQFYNFKITVSLHWNESTVGGENVNNSVQI